MARQRTHCVAVSSGAARAAAGARGRSASAPATRYGAGLHRGAHRVRGVPRSVRRRCRRRGRRHSVHRPRDSVAGRTHADARRRSIVVHLYGYPADAARHRPAGHRRRRTGPRRAARSPAVRRRPRTASTRPRTSAGSATAARWSPIDADLAEHGPHAARARHDRRSTSTRTSRRTSGCRRSRRRGCGSALDDAHRRCRPPPRDRRPLPTGGTATCAGRPTDPAPRPTISPCFAVQIAAHGRAALGDRRRRPRPSTTRWRSPSSRHTATSPHAPCPEAEAWAAECVTRAMLPGDDRRRSRSRVRRRLAGREPMTPDHGRQRLGDVPVLQRRDDHRRTRRRCARALRRWSPRSR